MNEKRELAAPLKRGRTGGSLFSGNQSHKIIACTSIKSQVKALRTARLSVRSTDIPSGQGGRQTGY